MCNPSPIFFALGAAQAELERVAAIRAQQRSLDQHFSQQYRDDVHAIWMRVAAAKAATPAKDCGNCGSPEFVKHRGRWICSYCRTGG